MRTQCLHGARMYLTASNGTYIYMHVCNIASGWSHTNSLTFLICTYNHASISIHCGILIFNTCMGVTLTLYGVIVALMEV